MADRLILCSECGTRNRIGVDRAARPTCGNCGKVLSVPGYSGTGLGQFFKPVKWFAFGVLSVIGIFYYNDPNFIGTVRNFVREAGFNLDDAPLAPRPVTATAPDETTVDNYGLPEFNVFDQFDAPPAPSPSKEVGNWEDEVLPVTISTGVVKHAKKAVAPLKIITAEGFNYFVKLVDMKHQTVMTMYIVGGEPLETKAPLGTFRIKYVAGHNWYGEKDRRFFGEPPNTIASKADEIFEFSVQHSETETIYSGHTIELILQTYGNLRVSRIPVEDF